MQYKCTITGVAIQKYAVGGCDIKNKDRSLMIISYTFIHIYLTTYVKRERLAIAHHK
jgi:hypothetical protein